MRSNGLWLKCSLPALLLVVVACTEPQAPPPNPEETAAQVIEQVLALAPNPEHGRAVFEEACIHCHGDQASGAPPTDFDLGDENPRRFRGYQELSYAAHVEVVVRGFVSKQSGRQNMPAFVLRLRPQQIADVAAYEQQIMAQSAPYQTPGTRPWMGLPAHELPPAVPRQPLSEVVD